MIEASSVVPALGPAEEEGRRRSRFVLVLEDAQGNRGWGEGHAPADGVEEAFRQLREGWLAAAMAARWQDPEALVAWLHEGRASAPPIEPSVHAAFETALLDLVGRAHAISAGELCLGSVRVRTPRLAARATGPTRDAFAAACRVARRAGFHRLSLDVPPIRDSLEARLEVARLEAPSPMAIRLHFESPASDVEDACRLLEILAEHRPQGVVGLWPLDRWGEGAPLTRFGLSLGVPARPIAEEEWERLEATPGPWEVEIDVLEVGGLMAARDLIARARAAGGGWSVREPSAVGPAIATTRQLLVRSEGCAWATAAPGDLRGGYRDVGLGGFAPPLTGAGLGLDADAFAARTYGSAWAQERASR